VKHVLLPLLVLAGCSRTTLVGSLICSVSADCAPPASVCSADGHCVPGCTPESCGGGATCDAVTGECSGGVLAHPCGQDSDCDPPDLVCRTSTMTCVPGCTVVVDSCAAPARCNPLTGHCCDGPSCPDRPDAGIGCNADPECPGAPANICSGGACVPGCTQTGCMSPLSCEP
jgi:hypothetical protein